MRFKVVLYTTICGLSTTIFKKKRLGSSLSWQNLYVREILRNLIGCLGDRNLVYPEKSKPWIGVNLYVFCENVFWLRPLQTFYWNVSIKPLVSMDKLVFLINNMCLIVLIITVFLTVPIWSKKTRYGTKTTTKIRSEEKYHLRQESYE